MKKIYPENNVVKAVRERFGLNFSSAIHDGKLLIMKTGTMNFDEAMKFKEKLSSFFSEYINVNVNMRTRKACHDGTYIDVSVIYY